MAIFVDLDAMGVHPKQDFTDRSLRDKRYKVIVLDRKIARLHDMKTDPAEEVNLVDSNKPEHKQAKAKFAAILKGLPEHDHRPRYTPTPAQPWEKKPDKAKPVGTSKKRNRRKSKVSEVDRSQCKIESTIRVARSDDEARKKIVNSTNGNNKKKTSHLAILVMFLVGYPISFGPVGWLFRNVALPGPLAMLIWCFYTPLEWLADHSATFRGIMSWYQGFFM